MPAGYTPELPGIEREAPVPVPSMRTAILGSLAAAVLALLLFSWLADEVLEGDTRRFDDSVRTVVHHFASPLLTRAMVFISALGSQVLVAVVVVAFVVFMLLKWRRAAVWLLLTMAGGLLLEVTLKYAFHRARPAPFFGAVPTPTVSPAGTRCCLSASTACSRGCCRTACALPRCGPWFGLSPPCSCWLSVYRAFISGCIIPATSSPAI